MLIAHLSDLHVTEGPALEDQRQILESMVDRILADRPDLVLLTGDYYGRTVPHRPTPRERAVLEPQIVRLAECAPVLVLEGNHDHGEALGLAGYLGGAYPITVLDKAGTSIVQTPAGPARIYWLAYPTRRWLLAGERPAGVAEGRELATRKIHGLLAAWRGRMERQRERDPDVPILFLGHFQARGSRLSSGEVLATGEIEIERPALDVLPVDYGALGHVHQRQELAPRWWYVGDPWPVDFGERGARGFHWITVNADHDVPRAKGTAAEVAPYDRSSWGQLPAMVSFVPSGARPWVTVRYRWASDREDGAPRWIERPSDQELEGLAGAVVRARLTVPDVHASSCPWEAEIEGLERIAHRVQAERVIEPTARVRAPEVAEAASLPDKLRAWWGTLETTPEDQDQAAALEALAELQELEDDQILESTRDLVAEAKARPAPTSTRASSAQAEAAP